LPRAEGWPITALEITCDKQTSSKTFGVGVAMLPVPKLLFGGWQTSFWNVTLVTFYVFQRGGGFLEETKSGLAFLASVNFENDVVTGNQS
jgi:hypothetical protein